MKKEVKSRKPVVFVPIEDESSRKFWEESGYKVRTVHFASKKRLYAIVPVESEEERRYLQNLYDADLKREQRYKEKWKDALSFDVDLQEVLDAMEEPDTPEDIAMDMVLLNLLMDEVVDLSEEKQRIAQMIANKELERDVAEELGIPKTTLNYRKKKLIKELKEIFNV